MHTQQPAVTPVNVPPRVGWQKRCSSLAWPLERGAGIRSAEREASSKERQEAQASWKAEAPPALPPGLYNTREAAKYLGVSTGTVFNYTHPRGPLPSVRIGGLVRYSKADLDAAIAGFKAGPKA